MNEFHEFRERTSNVRLEPTTILVERRPRVICESDEDCPRGTTIQVVVDELTVLEREAAEKFAECVDTNGARDGEAGTVRRHDEARDRHRAVARLVERGKVSDVITQNIDGLHQAAGVPGAQVIEVHGNATFAKCLACGTRHEFDDIEPKFKATKEPPVCTACGGIVKSATISFGQAMPEEEMERAAEASLGCDLFLAIGSSLVVYPAAGLPIAAKRNGAKLVILNRDPTELDHMADLVINAEIGPTLAKVVGVN